MRLVVIMIFAFFAFAKANSQQTKATATHTVVLKEHPASLLVEQFFKDFHNRDTLQLRQHFVEKPAFSSLAIRNGNRRLSHIELDNFIKRVGFIPATTSFKEELTSIQVLAGEDITTVHADYNFIFEGKLSHTGRNSFTLMYIDDEWKIVQLADTRVY